MPRTMIRPRVMVIAVSRHVVVVRDSCVGIIARGGRNDVAVLIHIYRGTTVGSNAGALGLLLLQIGLHRRHYL